MLVGLTHLQKEKTLNLTNKEKSKTVYIRDRSKLKKFRKSKNKNMDKMYQAKANKKKVGIVILVSNKIEFRQNQSKRDKVEHFIKLKCTICSENTHTNNGSTKLR